MCKFKHRKLTKIQGIPLNVNFIISLLAYYAKLKYNMLKEKISNIVNMGIINIVRSTNEKNNPEKK